MDQLKINSNGHKKSKGKGKGKGRGKGKSHEETSCFCLQGHCNAEARCCPWNNQAASSQEIQAAWVCQVQGQWPNRMQLLQESQVCRPDPSNSRSLARVCECPEKGQVNSHLFPAKGFRLLGCISSFVENINHLWICTKPLLYMHPWSGQHKAWNASGTITCEPHVRRTAKSHKCRVAKQAARYLNDCAVVPLLL